MMQTAHIIASKMVKELSTGVIDLNEYREAKIDQKGSVLSIDSIRRMVDQGYDPLHSIYIFGQNLTSVFAEGVSEMPEASKFITTVTAAKDEYLPEGPPISPLTISYFTMWAYYDLLFGKSKDTIGNCLLEFIQLAKLPEWISEVISNMNSSRMGFYLHSGFQNDKIVLREIGTKESHICICPSGYSGQQGEIWFVRLCPPIKQLASYFIVMTTPYIVLHRNESEILSFIDRSSLYLKNSKKNKTRNSIPLLMKSGPRKKFWHEYIFCSFSSYSEKAIFLEGIYDIPGSMPHCNGF